MQREAENSSPKIESAPPLIVACLDSVDWASFGVTTAFTLTIYIFTVAPEVTLGFSGIFSTSAMYFGVPHPPGYPLWTIYAGLFIKLLPFGNVAWRVAVSSAAAAAAASGTTALIVSHSSQWIFRGVPRWNALRSHDQRVLRGVAGYAAGMLLGLSNALWGVAVIADTCALSALLIALVSFHLMRWMHTRRNYSLYAT